jgi:hypothetical protein
MRVLSTSELLETWERGLGQPPPQRTLTLLAAACSETPLDLLEHLSIGQRDARLLMLREWTFGPKLLSLATCLGCQERLELTLDVADVRAVPAVEPPGEELSLNVEGYALCFRLPNSEDLAVIAHQLDVATARQILLRHCLLAAHQDGREQSADQLPPRVVDAIVEHMQRVDSQADIRLSLLCPQCGHSWQIAFDIASFFWSEINAWANRILWEVHILASRYGWSQRDILALSPWRRQFYLDVVNRANL